MKMTMRNSIFASLILLLILSGCSGEDLKDSDFRIDVKSNPDEALRTIFFLGDSIAFYEDGRPVVDTVKGRKFGIRILPTGFSGDTLKASFEAAKLLSLARDSITPAVAKIRYIYLSFPGLQAYWKIGPQKGGNFVEKINMIFPNTLRAGTFQMKVGATLTTLEKDTGNVVRPVFVTVPEKTVLVNLK
jgi:hypothetical protein